MNSDPTKALIRCLGDEKRALTKEKWSLELIIICF